ncbi:serrate RNA effector molecule-like [Chenopodium quinoa]|uniref:serrate RNA effector molecule-like n=1 Tax=Chenopodium quinoa TaxID=63459 RepID=UPI000B76C07E|nr:serrate RNA effector molecule-like [Chenopodium quinoa]
MAEVMNMPIDSVDNRRRSKEKPDDTPADSSPPPPPPPPPHRRRDRDSRERRDDRDFDRPPPNRYYDRNNRGGGGGGGGDRDRDYNKRSRGLSPSPPHPPPPYRDNRRNNYSPPPRRSPPYPPFKRSRRDDGYDGRRGSPRGGGYGPGDRRFGYDHPGGYDREMGGRPGYGDDRTHGRFRSGGYPNGPSDWEAGRGGYGDSSNAGNAQREGLMSYKQFIQELEDDVVPAEAERRYQEYKSEYISTQKRTYFEAHKDEEWLKNKYHPTNLLTVIERRNELARKVAKDFLLDLHSGSLDMGPGANALTMNKSGQTSEPNSEDETDVNGKRRRHGRAQAKDADVSAALKAHPVSSEPRRIQIDIELAQALITKLDSEKGIEDNILSKDDADKMSRDRSHSGSIGPVIIIRGLTSVKGLEGVELLDTLATYLWRVHGVDYYGMIETAEPKGLRHVRAEGKNSDFSSSAADWEKKLDSHWQDRLRSQDPLEVMTAKEKIDAAAVEALDPFVRKIRDEKYGWKYGCGAKSCTKLFHAAEYVHKHLKLKHPELSMDVTTKVREDIYFQNYMSDPDAPGGQPVMQQFVPKDKLQRRRPGADNRMKDDRGNRRERDRNGGERFERLENPQAEFPPNKDAPEKGNPDEPMFENFGGQGMHVAPFATDIAPPPVLMPVPGAGPLGPFVPAPPDVAMRMLREQGGPSPFDAPGRNGMGAPPIILPPSFRQDPRRLRSYQDLDAPEDEVTVIDYRSL